MMILQPHDSARLVAAILHKLGETSITISPADLQSLPHGQIEAMEDNTTGAVTYTFRQHDRPGQASLGFDEPVPDLPPIGEDEMPQTRAREHLDFETRSSSPLLTVEVVRQELQNAAENGHTFEDWTADQIAEDLISYSSACENADPALLAALVLEARRN